MDTEREEKLKIAGFVYRMAIEVSNLENNHPVFKNKEIDDSRFTRIKQK